MSINHSVGRERAIEEARLLLQWLPIPWNEFEQAVREVLNANPPFKGEALRDLIVEAALREWMCGSGHC
jgi:hypothetical protein